MAAVVAAVRVGEADGVVVVVIEERALDARAGGIVGGALGSRGMTDECSRARLLHKPGDITPAAGASPLEKENDIAEAYIHSLHHLYHAMKVVRHTDRGVKDDFPPFGSLNNRCLFPLFLHSLSQRRENNRGIMRVHV